VNGAVPVGGGDPKLTIPARDGLHPLVLADMQSKVLGDAAVIFERFQARGLRQGCRERNIANLEQLRRSEKHHVIRIVIEGIDQASLVDDERLEAGLLDLDGAGQTGGASAHDQDIAGRVGPRMSLRAGQSFGNLFNGQGCRGLHRGGGNPQF